MRKLFKLSSLKDRPALLLFTLLSTVYLLTMGVNRGGFGYSPDGTFAFEMAKSVVLDPHHKYLKQHYNNFSRWGPGMPTMLTPFVALAKPFADIAPQRDRLKVNGHEYLVSHFPDLGHESMSNVEQTYQFGIPSGHYSELTIISHLGLSAAIQQGVEVASIRITKADGTTLPLSVRAGIESAEWAHQRADVQRVVQHDLGNVAGSHIGNTRGNFYFHRYKFETPIDAREGLIVYTGPPGKFFLVSAALQEATSGKIREVPGTGRVWSERQNRAFFSPILVPCVECDSHCRHSSITISKRTCHRVRQRCGHGSSPNLWFRDYGLALCEVRFL